MNNRFSAALCRKSMESILRDVMTDVQQQELDSIEFRRLLLQRVSRPRTFFRNKIKKVPCNSYINQFTMATMAIFFCTFDLSLYLDGWPPGKTWRSEPGFLCRCRLKSVTDRLYSRYRADTWRRKMNQPTNSNLELRVNCFITVRCLSLEILQLLLHTLMCITCQNHLL